MDCPKCHAEITEDSHFCSKCGASLRGEAAPVSETRTISEPSAVFEKGPLVADKYKIIGEIGRGGMGVVYKAEDTRLDRIVALKFLPPELTRDGEARTRFIQEAKAAAALDHPNICTVYEVDEAEGRTFISMAYIQGQSLKDRLKPGPLDIDEANAIGCQVAEGLKEAHEQGIIHRDIKPANIMVTDKGQAKITDFGLAKLSWGADLTKRATVMGTAAYMSPEQARGEPVDRRSDIWSFGATLYEMITGKLPFRERRGEAFIHAILNEQPGFPSAFRPGVPRGMDRLVLKALEKDPTRRYQGMDEVLNDLKTVRTTSSVAEPKASIIVLPFENMSPDPDQEYFCDGMTEEIITDLTHIRDLLVISRNSAMTFKGSKKKTGEIAGEARVRYVLEGSVRKAGNNLRITAQLIDAETDAHLWAEKYTGTMNDIFDIQERVSRSIADSLKLKLGSSEKKMISKRPMVDVQAYEFYLKARQEIYSFTEQGLNRALQYLENGVDIVGENVLLYSCLGIAYFQYWNLGVRIDESYLRKAEEYAERIFRIEPDSPHGRLILGLLRCFVDPQQAIKQYKSVLENDPYHDEALLWLCVVLIHLGKGEEADLLLERLLRIDFLNNIVKVLPGLKLYYQGEFERARQSLEKAFLMDKDNPVVLWQYARMTASSGITDRAISLFETVTEKTESGLAKMSRLFSLAFQDRKKDLIESISPEIVRWARRDWMASFWLAECLALIGETEMALDWLEGAVDLGYVNYPFITELDPFLAHIRGEARFQALVERVKREWEDFEV